MIDLKKEKCEVEKLMLGMYVTELDRPWIGTPFMLQGFLLENQADIDTIMSLCQFVYIDRTKSAGNNFIAPTKQDVAFKREGSVIRVKDPSKIISDKQIVKQSRVNPASKNSFIDILRELKNYKAPENIQRNTPDGTTYNVLTSRNTAAQVPVPYEKNLKSEQDSIAKQLVNDVSGFIGGLFSRQKYKDSVDNTPTQKTKQEQLDNSYRLTIYEEELPVENEIEVIYPVYEQSQIATREIFNSVANDHDLDLSAVSEILDSMVESIGRTPDALLWLAKLKQTDDYSYNHALNVSITLMAFGNFLALSKKQIKELGLAGLLQDIGKVKISSDILLKEGKLTREEFEYAKKHVDEGLKILINTANIPASVVDLVSQHHERIDGSGYPNKLIGNQIGLMAQAAGLIDTYCAITSHKAYSRAVFHQQALDDIHHLSGKLFSSELVDQLVQFMGMYPVSSLVELNTAEVAVVIQQNQVRRLLPRLMLVLDPTKQRYKSPVILNLLNSPPTPMGEPYRIVKSVAPDSYGLNSSDFFI